LGSVPHADTPLTRPPPLADAELVMSLLVSLPRERLARIHQQLEPMLVLDLVGVRSVMFLHDTSLTLLSSFLMS
jgi:hypothetical protein